jgi:hypothetical protein
MRKRCANDFVLAHYMRKHAQTCAKMRKNAQTYTNICADDPIANDPIAQTDDPIAQTLHKPCANIAQTLRKHCANMHKHNICANYA